MRKISAIALVAIIVVGVVWYNAAEHGDDEVLNTSHDKAVDLGEQNLEKPLPVGSTTKAVSEYTRDGRYGSSQPESQHVDSRPDLSPEGIYNTDYLSYDKDTLAALADSGDLTGLHIASLRTDLFSHETREEYVLAAAKRGELSGLIRMFFEHLPDESQGKEGDAATAYGYLIAAQHLDAPSAHEADLSGMANLSEEELLKAQQFADGLVMKIIGKTDR